MKTVTVKVTLKTGVLDPQGQAIVGALHASGFPEAHDARQGKFIDLVLDDGTPDSRVREMCEKLLANPVVEDFEIL